MKNKYFYPIFKLKIKSWIKYWLVKKTEFKGKLSEILEGFSFTLNNTLAMKFNLFEIYGNSVQDGTPSPETQVPILSSGDNGTINENISNKNLFDKDKAKNVDYYIEPTTGSKVTQIGCMMSDFILVKENTSYVRNKKNDSNGNTFFASLIFCDKNKNYISGLWFSDNTFTTPAGTRYINLFSTRNRTNNENEEFVQDFMVEPGTTATPYVPHEEQDYSIFVQQSFRSNKDKTIRDCFVKKSDGWYERHKFEQVDLGTKDFRAVNNSEDSRTQGLFYTTISEIKSNTNYSIVPNDILSNKYISGNAYKYLSPGRNPTDRTMSRYLKNIYIQNSDFSGYTNEQVKEAMAGTILQYPRETHLDLPCTETQIQQLENKPSTYKDFTIIQSEDETPAYLKIQYYKEG